MDTFLFIFALGAIAAAIYVYVTADAEDSGDTPSGGGYVDPEQPRNDLK